MKKVFLALLPCLLLASCAGKQGDNAAQAVASRFSGADSMVTEATVSAEFSDRTADYTLSYTYKKGAPGTVTVLAPESIAGIRATMTPNGSKLQFENTILETGVSNEQDVTPMNALARLREVWALGNPKEIGAEKQGEQQTWILVHREGEIEYRTWFLKENLCPIFAEIFCDGRRILRVKYEKCEM